MNMPPNRYYEGSKGNLLISNENFIGLTHSSKSCKSSLSLSSPSCICPSAAFRCRIRAFAPHCRSDRAFLFCFFSFINPSFDTLASSFSKCLSCNRAPYRTRIGRRRIYPPIIITRRSQSTSALNGNKQYLVPDMSGCIL